MTRPLSSARAGERFYQAARPSILGRRHGQDGDAGMTTAEYAVGTVAACGFGGLLFKIVTSDSVAGMLRHLIERALTLAF